MKLTNVAHLPVIPDALEQFKGLFETILAWVFSQYKIITTTCCDKYNRSHIIKTLNPFPPFISLAANIKHTEETQKTKFIIFILKNTSISGL